VFRYSRLCPFLMKISENNDIYDFVSSDLDLWPLDLKFVFLVTLAHRYVSTKLEVSTAFLFRENRRHRTNGQTDGRGATLNAASKKGRVITGSWSCSDILQRCITAAEMSTTLRYWHYCIATRFPRRPRRYCPSGFRSTSVTVTWPLLAI